MTIGERLRKEREKKGYSLEEVHGRLRIHPSILGALEENNFEALPASIYTKGFLKRYSEFLELNSHELLSEYDSLDIHDRPQAFEIGGIQQKKAPPSMRMPRIPWGSIKGWVIRYQKPLFYVPLALIVFLILMTVFDKVLGPRLESISSRVMQKRSQESTSRSPSQVSSRRSQSRTRRENYIHSAEQNNFPALKSEEPLRLAIRATTDAWVRISADDKVVLETILKPGQLRELSAKRSFELKLGRPAGVQLGINGYALGSPGKGQATHVVINHNGMIQLR